MGGLDLRKRRRRYTSSPEGEEVEAHNCPCGKAIESVTNIIAKCELFKGERDALGGGMGDVNEGGMNRLMHYTVRRRREQ